MPEADSKKEYFLEGPQACVISVRGCGRQVGTWAWAEPRLRRAVQLTPVGLSFFFTGPLSHYFYLFLERWVPPEVPLAGVLKLLLDRVLFAPAFLLLFFVIMNFLEGRDAAALAARVRSGFWPALQMNWRVWTPVQFINVNYVPLQARTTVAGQPAEEEPGIWGR